MKHFDKLIGVYIQLELPEKWGDPVAAITADGESLHDLVWNAWERYLRVCNESNNPLLAHFHDVTNGFDCNTLRCRITHFDSEEMLERSIEYAEQAMNQAYEMLSDRRKRYAKSHGSKKVCSKKNDMGRS